MIRRPHHHLTVRFPLWLSGLGNRSPLSGILASLAVVLAAIAPQAFSQVTFQIDASGQVGGSRVFRHVPHIAAISYSGQPDGWMTDRYEDTIWANAGWYGLSNITVPPDPNNPLWRDAGGGRIVFEPSPGIERAFDTCSIRAGVKPLIVVGTPTIPPPLVEGGSEAGEYGFNVRQPNDYAKWSAYLDSMFQWLAGRYGKEEVRSWGFLFGIESDWQAKCVKPGTNELMDRDDNRREFLKMVDYFKAALDRNLGPGVYLGIYGAFEHQSEKFIEHWGGGTNFATGKTGSRIAYTGFSDWTLLDFVDDLNPMSLEGEAKRAAQADAFTAMASTAAGLVWKHDHIANWADAHPSLRGLEVNLPEAGYFDTKGGTAPDGSTVPADYLPADHQGAALYGLRLIGYSRTPRIAWAWNRYALGTGDVIYNPQDTAKPPVFQVQRLSRKLHGERILPIVKEGEPPDRTAIEAMALATTESGYQWNVLVSSFNRDAAAPGTEKIRLQVDGLGGLANVKAEVFRIDQQHNNWWQEWTKTREEKDLPFVAGPNRGHLGANVLYKAEYLRNTLDVLGTMRPEDHQEWLLRCGEFANIALTATDRMEAIPVEKGRAAVEIEVPPNCMVFVKLTPAIPVAFPPLPEQLGSLSLPLGATSQSRPIRIGGLVPETEYTLTARAKSTMRVAEYGISLQRPDGAGKVSGFGDYSGRANPIVLTARTDKRGGIEVIPFTDAQEAAKEDAVLFEFLSLVPTVPTPKPVMAGEQVEKHLTQTDK